MATIVQRGKSYSVVYRAVNRDGVRKQKWETYQSHDAALKRKEEVENPLGGLGIPPYIQTLSQLLDEYVALCGVAKWSMSTHSAMSSLIQNYIRPHIGKAKLEQINSRLIQRYYQMLRESPPAANRYRPNQQAFTSAGTIREIHKLLSSVFTKATTWGVIDSNPTRNIDLPKHQSAPRQILTLEQIAMILEHFRQNHFLMAIIVQLAFTCSLRKGELLALQWDDINFESGTLSVSKELARVSKASMDVLNCKGIHQIFPTQKAGAKSRLVLKIPKTAASVRTIFLPDMLRADLLKWRDIQNTFKHHCGIEYHDHGLIIAQENGCPLPEKEISRWFSDSLKTCSLPQVVFHSLRHSSTTYKLIIGGGDIKAVQRDNGHAKPDMVLNVYGRAMDESRRELARKTEMQLYASMSHHLE